MTEYNVLTKRYQYKGESKSENIDIKSRITSLDKASDQVLKMIILDLYKQNLNFMSQIDDLKIKLKTAEYLTDDNAFICNECGICCHYANGFYCNSCKNYFCGNCCETITNKYCQKCTE